MVNLHDLVDNLKRKSVWDSCLGRTMQTAAPDVLSWLLDVSQKAVCFHLGDVLDAPVLKIVPDLYRLPYAVVWMEAVIQHGVMGVLACEVGENEWHLAVLNKQKGVWRFFGALEVSLAPNELGVQDVRLKRRVCISTGAIAEKEFEYLKAAAMLSASFLMALNCKNTAAVEHHAPKFLNQKRAAKGRQPLFSYWTLHLPGTARADGQPLGGTHASPRVHLRRGHIRQHAPGEYTWVNAHVVGSKQAGIVMKDYAMRPRPSTASPDAPTAA